LQASSSRSLFASLIKPFPACKPHPAVPCLQASSSHSLLASLSTSSNRYCGLVLNKTEKRLQTQKIHFIATGFPIMLSLAHQKGTPFAKSGTQGTKLSSSITDIQEPLKNGLVN
jgi:hypothetical protein